MEKERTWGPIIMAIEAGHVEVSNGELKGKCRACEVRWGRFGCPVMRQARRDQLAYAEKLATKHRHANALALRAVSARP